MDHPAPELPEPQDHEPKDDQKKEGEMFDDPNTVLRREVDLSFFEGKNCSYPLPKTQDPVKILKAITIPHIDLDAEPDSRTILNFLYDIMAFPIEDKLIMMYFLSAAIDGHKAKGWMRATRYDCKKILHIIINWMIKRDDWIKFKSKLEQSKTVTSS